MSGDVLAVLSICRATAVSATHTLGEHSKYTDDFGVLLHTGVLACERVLQTLHELPQGLLVWLPRHDGRWLALLCGKLRRVADGVEVDVRGRRSECIVEDFESVYSLWGALSWFCRCGTWLALLCP